MSYIRTKGGLHLILQGQPRTVAATDPVYPDLVAALNRSASDEEIVELLEAELRRMAAAVEVAPEVTLKAGMLYFRDEPIVGTIGERMLGSLKEGFDLKPMAAFLANLALNPSNRVVSRLYDFLEEGKNAITPDGHFLAFKAIRPNWTDIRTGKFNNAVGQIVSVPRNKVDDRDEITCSHGLHVCSFDYLPYFSHANGHVVVCKVNPADVVSIPVDYRNTKMRLCKYEVVGEYAGYYEGKGNVLSSRQVVAAHDGEPFAVECQETEEGPWVPYSFFGRLSAATAEFDDQVGGGEVFAVRIRNVETDVVLDSEDSAAYVAPSDAGDAQEDIDERYYLEFWPSEDNESPEPSTRSEVPYDTVGDAASVGADWLDSVPGQGARVEIYGPAGLEMTLR